MRQMTFGDGELMMDFMVDKKYLKIDLRKVDVKRLTKISWNSARVDYVNGGCVSSEIQKVRHDTPILDPLDYEKVCKNQKDAPEMAIIIKASLENWYCKQHNINLAPVYDTLGDLPEGYAFDSESDVNLHIIPLDKRLKNVYIEDVVVQSLDDLSVYRLGNKTLIHNVHKIKSIIVKTEA